MTTLKGNLLFGQSGGPTSVINASAAGVFIEALKHGDIIEKVYGAAHGIVGVLNENFYDMSKESDEELLLLKNTPSSALGSCRYKLADPAVDDTDYKRILEVFQKNNIRYFFYNGGNDSMDTCNKLSKYMQQAGYECRVLGVPKTIDNDLMGTDHCPGFGSAARYIATTVMEVNLDARVYDKPMICVIEIMGRHAGWLTAAASLARLGGHGPDLIYLPEVPFDFDKMLEDVREVYEKSGKVIICVSEGVHSADGRFLAELAGDVSVDAFGHKQLGGTAQVLAQILGEKFGSKVRAIELSLMQRCAAHLASGVDIEETFAAGAFAVQAALAGATDKMVAYKRLQNEPYEIEMELVPLSATANTEKNVPREWINQVGNNVTDEFIAYAKPLILGENTMKTEKGLPRFAKLKKYVVNCD